MEKASIKFRFLEMIVRNALGRRHCASQTSPLETIEAFKDLLFALYKRGFLPNVHRSSRASKANITKADGR